jgi:thioredoxin reductase (NADPH)
MHTEQPFPFVDVAIVGAGPAGLFSVFQCGMLGLRTAVMDILPNPGGQCTALYPEKPVYDIPAWPRITGGDLVSRLEEQARPFAPLMVLGHIVTTLEPQADGSWVVRNAGGAAVQARAVLITAGGGSFEPNRPPLPGITGYEGHSVFYYVRQAEIFRNRNVVIAGGGDSAVDWAVTLAGIASRVYLVHRRPTFRAAPASEAQLRELATSGRIHLMTPFQLAGLRGDGKQLTHVTLEGMDNSIQEIEADALLPFFGLAMSPGPLARWGLTMDQKQIVVSPETLQTSRPGVWAAGDICTYPGKLRLILCGFSEAAMAAHNIRATLNPDQAFHFEHSTTRGVPEKGF